MRDNVPSKLTIAFLVVAGLSTAGTVASGQVEGTQSYCLRVGPRLTASAPPAQATMSLDVDNPETSFAPQRWNVASTSQSGVTVSFATTRAFTHTERPEFKRDAGLELAIPATGDEAKWTVAVGSHRTSHALGAAREKASVRAISNGPGQGAFDITVSFLADPNDTLESGEYALTLVGTITAN